MPKGKQRTVSKIWNKAQEVYRQKYANGRSIGVFKKGTPEYEDMRTRVYLPMLKLYKQRVAANKVKK